MIAPLPPKKNAPKHIRVRVLRQEAPGKEPYWELFDIDYEREMNVISVLQKIAAKATNADGTKVTPVAWDCGCLEEVCGACTMVINGRVRQSCSALVDQLLIDNPDEIVLEPMTKFPVIRDLLVNRQRIFHDLKRIKGWVPVDSYFDLGPGERQSRAEQEQIYPLSECMSCGCCLDACPQYAKVELIRHEGETEEQFEARKAEAHNHSFMGAHAISQAMRFNQDRSGKALNDDRLDALMGPGGVTTCGNAQNCVAVCPKRIPLTRSIARAGRATTVAMIKRWFER